MSFGFDAGSEGGEGPWFVWSARGTLDGEIPAKTFYIRDGSKKTPNSAITATGIIMDIHGLKTGWQFGEGKPGVAPQWVFGTSPARLPESPGKEWKKGFSMKVAIGGGLVVKWEQSGAAAWNALTNLIPALNGGPVDDKSKLPLVRMTGSVFEQFSSGSTNTPTLEIVKWVDRPACLKEGFSAGVDAGPPDTPAPAPVRAPQPVSAGDVGF